MKIIFTCQHCKKENKVVVGEVISGGAISSPELDPPLSIYEKEPPYPDYPTLTVLDQQHPPVDEPTDNEPPQSKHTPPKQEPIDCTEEQMVQYNGLEQEIINRFEHLSNSMTFDNESKRSEWVHSETSKWIETATTMKAYTAEYIPTKMIPVVISEYKVQFAKPNFHIDYNLDNKEKKRLIGLELAIHFQTQTKEGKSNMSKWLSKESLVHGFTDLRNIPSITEGNEKQAQWLFERIEKKWKKFLYEK